MPDPDRVPHDDGASRFEHRPVERRKNLSGLLGERSTRLRRGDPAAGSVEQLDAELPFELPDRLRERWLLHEQAFGRPPEVELFEDCQEVPQVPQSDSGVDRMGR